MVFKARALKSYQTTNPEKKLSYDVGDIVEVVEEQKGWWRTASSKKWVRKEHFERVIDSTPIVLPSPILGNHTEARRSFLSSTENGFALESMDFSDTENLGIKTPPPEKYQSANDSDSLGIEDQDRLKSPRSPEKKAKKEKKVKKQKSQNGNWSQSEEKIGESTPKNQGEENETTKANSDEKKERKGIFSLRKKVVKPSFEDSLFSGTYRSPNEAPEPNTVISRQESSPNLTKKYHIAAADTSDDDIRKRDPASKSLPKPSFQKNGPASDSKADILKKKSSRDELRKSMPFMSEQKSNGVHPPIGQSTPIKGSKLRQSTPVLGTGSQKNSLKKGNDLGKQNSHRLSTGESGSISTNSLSQKSLSKKDKKSKDEKVSQKDKKEKTPKDKLSRGHASKNEETPNKENTSFNKKSSKSDVDNPEKTLKKEKTPSQKSIKTDEKTPSQKSIKTDEKAPSQKSIKTDEKASSQKSMTLADEKTPSQKSIKTDEKTSSQKSMTLADEKTPSQKSITLTGEKDSSQKSITLTDEKGPQKTPKKKKSVREEGKTPQKEKSSEKKTKKEKKSKTKTDAPLSPTEAEKERKKKKSSKKKSLEKKLSQSSPQIPVPNSRNGTHGKSSTDLNHDAHNGSSGVIDPSRHSIPEGAQVPRLLFPRSSTEIEPNGVQIKKKVRQRESVNLIFSDSARDQKELKDSAKEIRVAKPKQEPKPEAINPVTVTLTELRDEVNHQRMLTSLHKSKRMECEETLKQVQEELHQSNLQVQRLASQIEENQKNYERQSRLMTPSKSSFSFLMKKNEKDKQAEELQNQIKELMKLNEQHSTSLAQLSHSKFTVNPEYESVKVAKNRHQKEMKALLEERQHDFDQIKKMNHRLQEYETQILRLTEQAKQSARHDDRSELSEEVGVHALYQHLLREKQTRQKLQHALVELNSEMQTLKRKLGDLL